MNVAQLADQLRRDHQFMQDVTRWEVIPARPAQTRPFPESMDPRLIPVLNQRGIHSLYTHQALSLEATARGEDVTVVTPTASGKTMCYNLPVLSAILKDEDARALYLFPTKALSADQVSELYDMIEGMGVDIKTYTYDGDTPAAARRAIRQAGHIVVTNPDMLHSGILPHHTKWVKLFENLQYIVIDEIHTYRGVFGSNLANVLRRLMRLCDFYGSHPQYILCSATIANPRELAETLTGRPVTLVDENRAPMGERHFVFYNPPVVNRQLGIRKGAIPITRAISGMLLKNGIQSITFARSRLTVEVLTRYLKDMVRDPLGNAGRVRGYRGGYLPGERREIERGLRSGQVDAVVSTNALELGIDIGALDACVMCGYPGTIASAWQQAGRAGLLQYDKTAPFRVPHSFQTVRTRLCTGPMPVLLYVTRSEQMHIEKDREYKKHDNKTRGKLHEKSLHCPAFVFSPVSIALAGNRAQSLGFSLLHQDDNSHNDADDDHDNSQHNTQNTHCFISFLLFPEPAALLLKAGRNIAVSMPNI